MQARSVRSGAMIGLAALTAGLALVVGASAQDGAERKQPGAVGDVSGQTPAQSEQAQRAPITPRSWPLTTARTPIAFATRTWILFPWYCKIVSGGAEPI